MQLIPNGRVWIDTEKGSFLGNGRIELLEKIQETGSLRQAALAMKMSYQQAWNMIKEMNEATSAPLVLMQRGGKNGGTTLLSDKGLKAITLFKQYNQAFHLFLQSQDLTI
ncbi:winged helix-turn-helix domain-containing protein [Parasediminibacterium sp. JCM 36343]|uniref:winged helix-turn-helix domain-containing protein n=1 Tax=Parasediminibacterium sp. JCM 36343 TaxID=3374279 RepID=UPI00397A20E4